MAFSLNKVMLIGHLGRDGETRFTQNNVSVTTFTLATNYRYKGKDGNWVDETTWHNVTCFNLSDYFKEALKKGKKFYVEGRISKRDYTDKEGIKRYFTDVISERLIPLDSGGDANFSREEGTSVSESPVETDENSDLPF
jgi:single-strand DNA-binding protein